MLFLEKIPKLITFQITPWSAIPFGGNVLLHLPNKDIFDGFCAEDEPKAKQVSAHPLKLQQKISIHGN